MIESSEPLTPTPTHALDRQSGIGGDWSPLADAARVLVAGGGALSVATAGLIVAVAPVAWLDPGIAASAALLGLLPLFGAAVGWRIGTRRWQYTRWRLDGDGFALRRGRLWQRETRVPIARVQHLDLKRGPLERRRGLATLVLHTAGSQASTVSVGGLALADAEALRDRLLRAPVAALADADNNAP